MIDTARLPQRPKSARTGCVMNLMGALRRAGGRPRLCGAARVPRHQPAQRRRRAGGVGAAGAGDGADHEHRVERQAAASGTGSWLASSGAFALMLCLAAIVWKFRLNDWIW